MSSQGNGQRAPYQVRLSELLKNRILQLHQETAQQGRGQQFVAALKAIHERLRQEPEQFGEPLFHLPSLDLLVYQAVIAPVVVDYGVHQARPLVFLRGVKVLG